MSCGWVMVLVILSMLSAIFSLVVLCAAGRIVEEFDEHAKLVMELLDKREKLIEEKEHATRASKTETA